MAEVGDRVISPCGFAGTIIRKTKTEMVVRYADKAGENEATYTAEWFKQYPGMLQSTSAPVRKK